jgi:hypothetical protein
MMQRAGPVEGELIVRDVDGVQVAAYLLPLIPDDAPPLVREGIARRRLAALEDRCPCGGGSPLNRAARRRLARTRGQVAHLNFVHEDGCPAVDADLYDAIRAWSA